MALIPKVEPKQEKKVVSARLDDDNIDGPAHLERIFPSIDRPSRPLALRWAQSLLSHHAVHHTLHRLFILAVRALHLYVAAKTVTKAAAVAALPCCGISESAQRRHR